MVTEVIVTSSTGRSCAPVLALAIESTTARLSASATSPKMVCLRVSHEVGTTRMGADPKTAVVTANCQAHDVRNLFIADGGPFVTNADKNVTWTILALSMRTSEFIAQQRRQRNL